MKRRKKEWGSIGLDLHQKSEIDHKMTSDHGNACLG